MSTRTFRSTDQPGSSRMVCQDMVSEVDDKVEWMRGGSLGPETDDNVSFVTVRFPTRDRCSSRA